MLLFRVPGPPLNPAGLLALKAQHMALVVAPGKKWLQGANMAKMFALYPPIQAGFPGGPAVKHPPANAGDTGLIPELGRSPGEGNSNSPQYSCLENPMDRGAWQAAVHGIAKIWT